MFPRGGTLFLLLLLVAEDLGYRGGNMPGNKADLKVMKKLMWKCKEQGYRPPLESLMKSIFNSSDSPTEDPRSMQPSNLLSFFQKILEAVSQQGDPLARMPSADEMQNMMWNSSQLPLIIDQMKNRSEESVCFVRAFVAVLSWKALTTPKENITDMNDYEKLLLATKPALRDIFLRTMMLPKSLAREKVSMMMKLLNEMHEDLPDNRRDKVVKWLKQQMAQNNFSCTTEVNSDSRSMLPRCNSSVSWLSAETAGMLGPYLFNLRSDDVDSSPKEKLCEFFRTHSFPRAMRMRNRMKPSLARRFLRKCFSGEDFQQHVEKLGSLACYYDTDSDLAPALSKKLLPQLDECDNPVSKKLKQRLVRSMMSMHNLTQIAGDLGSSISYLSPENVSAIPWTDLKEIQQNVSVWWTPAQMHALVEKRIQGMKCKQMTSEELLDLKSLARGLPSCVLKKVTAMKMLMDKKELRSITRHMRRGQMTAVLQRLAKDVKPLELVQKLDNDLLRSMSLNYLAKVNITAVDQVNNKTWRPAQAFYLARKLKDMGRLHLRKLRSLLQGVTCSMYENLSDENVPDMVEAIEENPQCLSQSQARCAAEKLLQYLEGKRPNYFETITDEELDAIPTVLLISQPPWKLMGLPDPVCSTFLDKMENANLTCLPRPSPSRPALVNRALRCLGNDFSKLTSEDAARLGPLLCELQPSQLRLMAPEVLNFSLMAAASCEHIPSEHIVDLIKLVIQMFGEPSQWSPEMMEDLGPLLLLDDNYTAALPNKPRMIGILHFLRSRRMLMPTRALLRKHFDIIISSPSNTEQQRVARSVRSSDRSIANPLTVPTEELIAQVGLGNVFWSKEELELMSSDTFRATVETLGNILNFSPDQLAKLKEKAVQAFGSVEQMSESVVTQLGCISQGFSQSELEKLPFLLDNLEEIGRCGFNESQVASIWKAVAKYNGLSAPQLSNVEMVALDRFLCGLTSTELMQLNLEHFKEAVYEVGSVQCSRPRTQQLRSLAVSAFGDPSSWDEAQVSNLGNIIAGLDPHQLASLPAPVFSVIRKSCIPLIPPESLASLSSVHLEALGPERAARVTEEQRGALRADQQDALMRARAGLRSDTTGPSPLSVYSGGPPLNVQGILTFMKPLLVLLTGLLLL